MNVGHLSPDIQFFITLLDKHAVRALLVGGEAVIYYGYARVTGDVDFFFDASLENCDRLYAALVEFWGGDVPGFESAEELAVPDLVVQFGRPPNRLDLLAGLSGITFAEAWDGRVVESAVVDGRETVVNVIGLEALLANKRASARHKDLDDVEHLTPDE